MKVKELKERLKCFMDDDDVKVNISMLVDWGDDWQEKDFSVDIAYAEGNSPVLLVAESIEADVKMECNMRFEHYQLNKAGKDYKQQLAEASLLNRLAHMPWNEAFDYIEKHKPTDKPTSEQ